MKHRAAKISQGIANNANSTPVTTTIIRESGSEAATDPKAHSETTVSEEKEKDLSRLRSGEFPIVGKCRGKWPSRN